MTRNRMFEHGPWAGLVSHLVVRAPQADGNPPATAAGQSLKAFTVVAWPRTAKSLGSLGLKIGFW